jgi:hypothetical protein
VLRELLHRRRRIEPLDIGPSRHLLVPAVVRAGIGRDYVAPDVLDETCALAASGADLEDPPESGSSQLRV